MLLANNILNSSQSDSLCAYSFMGSAQFAASSWPSIGGSMIMGMLSKGSEQRITTATIHPMVKLISEISHKLNKGGTYSV